MAEEALVDEGRRMVQALREAGLAIEFAVWFTDPASGETMLAIGSGAIDKMGPSAAYEEIGKVFKSVKGGFRFFRSDMLKLISIRSRLGRALLRAFGKKAGDTIVGMFVSPDLVLQQVYAYGAS